MTEVVAFYFTGVIATQSWTADKDYDIVGVTGGSGVFSFEPNWTYALETGAPAANTRLPTMRMTTTDFQWMGASLRIPLPKGKTIYCAIPAVSGTRYLLLQPVEQVS